MQQPVTSTDQDLYSTQLLQRLEGNVTILRLHGGKIYFLFSFDCYWIFQQPEPNVIRTSTERNRSNYLFSFKLTFSCSLQVTSTLELKILLVAIQFKTIELYLWINRIQFDIKLWEIHYLLQNIFKSMCWNKC